MKNIYKNQELSKSKSEKLDWNLIQNEMKQKLGSEVYESWLKKIDFIEEFNSYILISVPTRFIRDWITSRYLDQILKIVKIFKKNLIRIEFKIVENNTSSKNRDVNDIQIKKSENISFLKDSFLQYNRVDHNKRFENFITGRSNKLAYEASLKVTENVSQYNPLYIYGVVGMGKTHLLNAVGFELKKKKKVMFIPAERFMYQFIKSIKANDMVKFKEYFRNTDILLIDDIQFFVGKKGVSEELFHTINFFLNNAKSVVLASDQKQQNLNGFPDRLVSRILNGLVTDITKPDKEIFSEVLKKSNVEFDGLLFSKNEFEMLLSLDFQSFREINGVINNLIINKQTGVSNNKYLSDLVSLYSNNKVVELSPEFILKYCSEVYQVDERLVLSKNRSELVSNARHLFVYLMRKHTEYSLNQIGLFAGNRSHSTVLSSIKKVESSSLFKKEVNIFNNKLEESSLKFVGV